MKKSLNFEESNGIGMERICDPDCCSSDLGLYYEFEKVEMDLRCEISNLQKELINLKKSINTTILVTPAEKNTISFKTGRITYLIPVDPLEYLQKRIKFSYPSDIEEIESFDSD